MAGQVIDHPVAVARGSKRNQRKAPARVRCLVAGDAGMTTAEYAIGTVAAAAFAALLYSVITGGSLAGALTSLIQRALESSL